MSGLTKDQFIDGALALQSSACGARVRYPLVLSGGRRWFYESLLGLAEELKWSTVLCWTDDDGAARLSDFVERVERQNYTQYLGTECDALFFDARAGINPNVLAALSGTVKAGGFLVLGVPDRSYWSSFKDLEAQNVTVYPHEDPLDCFWQRFQRWIPQAVWYEQDASEWPQQPQVVIPPPLKMDEADVTAEPPFAPCATAEQHQVVQSIVRLADGRRRRPLVITAARGRGKTTALGIATAQLLKGSRERRIMFLAPGENQVALFMRHVAQGLSLEKSSRQALDYGQSHLFYCNADQLNQQWPTADLVLVDEAAGFPTEFLERVVQRYTRVVFATTTDGYEGHGQGFKLRFQDVLQASTQAWTAQTLHVPIRWNAPDPLEDWVTDLLLMDARANWRASSPDVVGSARIERINRAALADDETLLRAVFGLLKEAHYRTTSGDLRILLDSPNIVLWIARVGSAIVGALMVAVEGGFDNAMARAMLHGERRPRGHALPGAVTAQMGFEDGARLQCLRVVRIAVHASLRRKRIASKLLSALEQYAETEGVDYVGAMFGGDAGTIAFWVRQGYSPVRVGFRPESSTGLHSLTVMRGISKSGEHLLLRVQQRFQEYWPGALLSEFKHLSVEQVTAIQLGLSFNGGLLCSQDHHELRLFASGKRGLEQAALALQRFALVILSTDDFDEVLSPPTRQALVRLVLQHRWGGKIDAVSLQCLRVAVLASQLRSEFIEPIL